MSYDYHSLFYYQVLVPLKRLRGVDGELIRGANGDAQLEFNVAYEPRKDRYAHNYLRDNHLSSRPKVIVGRRGSGDWVVLLSLERHIDKMVVYSRALTYLFNKEAPTARRELLELLGKFYDIKVKAASPYNKVDYSEGQQGDEVYVRQFAPTTRRVYPEGIMNLSPDMAWTTMPTMGATRIRTVDVPNLYAILQEPLQEPVEVDDDTQDDRIVRELPF